MSWAHNDGCNIKNNLQTGNFQLRKKTNALIYKNFFIIGTRITVRFLIQTFFKPKFWKQQILETKLIF